MKFNEEIDRIVNWRAEDRKKNLSILAQELRDYANKIEEVGIREIVNSSKAQREINLKAVLNGAQLVSSLHSAVDSVHNNLQGFVNFYEGVQITKAIGNREIQIEEAKQK